MTIVTRFRFGKDLRLRTKPEFDAVFAGNRSRGDRYLVLYLKERGGGEESVSGDAGPEAANGAGSEGLESRIGLVVGKKVGNAVVRNRVKRLLREAFRLTRHELPGGLDIVILPRPGAIDSYTLAGLQDSLRKLVRRPLPEPQPERPRGKKKPKKRT